MKAMILAAGLGTRLRPFTDTAPKALAPAGGIPLLKLALLLLRQHGFDRVVVNVHHFAKQVIDYLASNPVVGVETAISDERYQLLETGGGIVKAAGFLDGQEPFLVYNVDIVTNADLTALYKAHIRSGALVTLLSSRRPAQRRLLYGSHGRLCGWENTETGQRKMTSDPGTEVQSLAFSGVHVIDPALYGMIKEQGRFSILDVYLRLASDVRIEAYVDDDSVWIDAGTPAELEKAGSMLTVLTDRGSPD